MAQVSIVVSQPGSGNRYSTWSHIFQGANTIWFGFGTGNLTLGNFFAGLQGNVQSAFDAQIPPGATIVSATFEMTAATTNANPAFTATINSPNRNVQSYYQDAIQTPFELYEGYRQDAWSNAQVGALSTTFTAVFGTSVTTNANWSMRQISNAAAGATIDMNDHLAQLITTRTGNMTIASLFWDLSRVGNPAGTLRVRIQGVTVDRGVKIPNGIDVANGVSNTILCSSVPNAQTLTIFTFPVNPTLVPLTEYFILIEPTYADNNADYIRVHHQNAFLIANGGGLRHYGQGLGMDYQNSPGVVDLNQAWQLDKYPFEDVIWPIDAVTAGVVEVSPDISSLVQAQIDAPNYTQDAGIIIALDRVVPTNQSRIFRGNVTTPHVLRITYEEPLPPVIPDKLADPASRLPKNWEPWDPDYYRWKYRKEIARLQQTSGSDRGLSPTIERPDIMRDMLDQATLDELDARNASNERDILELQTYIAELTAGLEDDALQAELRAANQEAVLQRLEENVKLARETLLAALESRRFHQNQIAAVQAVIRFYY